MYDFTNQIYDFTSLFLWYDVILQYQKTFIQSIKLKFKKTIE